MNNELTRKEIFTPATRRFLSPLAQISKGDCISKSRSDIFLIENICHVKFFSA